MELVVFVAAFLVLDLLAWKFGVDSRDGQRNWSQDRRQEGIIGIEPSKADRST